MLTEYKTVISIVSNAKRTKIYGTTDLYYEVLRKAMVYEEITANPTSTTNFVMDVFI